MTFNINDDMTLSDIYSSALVVMREITVEEDKGDAVCRFCNNAKKVHVSDGRCDLYATSRTFMNNRLEEQAKALRAAGLIEELRAI